MLSDSRVRKSSKDTFDTERRFAAMTGYAADNAANATTVNVVLLSARIIIPSSLAD